jgi:hypothetical protein
MYFNNNDENNNNNINKNMRMKLMCVRGGGDSFYRNVNNEGSKVHL